MGRRRIWRRKPDAEKERRSGKRKEKIENRNEEPASPETDPRYMALSTMLREQVDGMLSLGIPLDQIMRGLF
jgi:hypothetical protein